MSSRMFGKEGSSTRATTEKKKPTKKKEVGETKVNLDPSCLWAFDRDLIVRNSAKDNKLIGGTFNLFQSQNCRALVLDRTTDIKQCYYRQCYNPLMSNPVSQTLPWGIIFPDTPALSNATVALALSPEAKNDFSVLCGVHWRLKHTLGEQTPLWGEVNGTSLKQIANLQGQSALLPSPIVRSTDSTTSFEYAAPSSRVAPWEAIRNYTTQMVETQKQQQAKWKDLQETVKNIRSTTSDASDALQLAQATKALAEPNSQACKENFQRYQTQAEAELASVRKQLEQERNETEVKYASCKNAQDKLVDQLRQTEAKLNAIKSQMRETEGFAQLESSMVQLQQEKEAKMLENTQCKNEMSGMQRRLIQVFELLKSYQTKRTEVINQFLDTSSER